MASTLMTSAPRSAAKRVTIGPASSGFLYDVGASVPYLIAAVAFGTAAFIVPTLTVRREVPSSPTELFDAWLDAGKLATWMRPGDSQRSKVRLDPRVEAGRKAYWKFQRRVPARRPRPNDASDYPLWTKKFKPDGLPFFIADTRTERDPRNPRNLDRVSVGDLVEITYTEAVAVSVDKPGNQ